MTTAPLALMATLLFSNTSKLPPDLKGHIDIMSPGDKAADWFQDGAWQLAFTDVNGVMQSFQLDMQMVPGCNRYVMVYSTASGMPMLSGGVASTLSLILPFVTPTNRYITTARVDPRDNSLIVRVVDTTNDATYPATLTYRGAAEGFHVEPLTLSANGTPFRTQIGDTKYVAFRDPSPVTGSRIWHDGIATRNLCYAHGLVATMMDEARPYLSVAYKAYDADGNAITLATTDSQPLIRTQETPHFMALYDNFPQTDARTPYSASVEIYYP
jgi:hypothetical protein